jgi:DNA-binding HxlR family transcriptional regulator
MRPYTKISTKNHDTCSPAILPLPPPEIATTLKIIGGKWKILILWHLWKRTCRFNELRRAIPGVTQHMLTTQLRELEKDGIIARTIFPEVPPRVEYALTDHGATLGKVFKVLTEWGAAHGECSKRAP